jgi:hypothetical protein
MSKKTLDQYCTHCGSEFMITFDEDNQMDEPVFCAFCAQLMTDEELEFDED